MLLVLMAGKITSMDQRFFVLCSMKITSMFLTKPNNYKELCQKFLGATDDNDPSQGGSKLTSLQ
jgi:hypothetical protein